MIESVYKTTQGTYWDTRPKALVADALEQSGPYLDRYTMASVVETITSYCGVYEISPAIKQVAETPKEIACPTHEFPVDVNPILETKEENK